MLPSFTFFYLHTAFPCSSSLPFSTLYFLLLLSLTQRCGSFEVQTHPEDARIPVPASPSFSPGWPLAVGESSDLGSAPA